MTLWAQFLHLLISKKALKILPGDICSSRQAEILCKKIIYAWLHVLTLHQNHIYVDLPQPSPASLEQFLRAIWDAVSQAIVLILPPVKLNSRLSHYDFFFQGVQFEKQRLLMWAWRRMRILDRPEFISQSWNLLVSGPWMSCSVFLRVSFITCKMGLQHLLGWGED